MDDLVGEIGVIDGSRDEHRPHERAEQHGLATRLGAGAAEQLLDVVEPEREGGLHDDQNVIYPGIADPFNAAAVR
ncbi:MAG TPA: hypothetical protein VMA96_15280 [Solirubrobacteraceae bacterium]|nr:hypothetical protein [Solirubrobacteraceae bacterium]